MGVSRGFKEASAILEVKIILRADCRLKKEGLEERDTRLPINSLISLQAREIEPSASLEMTREQI